MLKDIYKEVKQTLTAYNTAGKLYGKENKPIIEKA